MAITNNFSFGGGSSNNSYEYLTLASQEDLTEQVTTSIVKQKFNSTSGVGEMIGKQDPTKWDFQLVGNGRSVAFSNNISSTTISICGAGSSSFVTSLAGLNEILAYTSYNSKSYLQLSCSGGTTGANPYFYWDLQQACMPTFQCYIKGYQYVKEVYFQGSNNKTTWTTLQEVTSSATTTINYTPTEAYRYYRFIMTFNTNANGYINIGYMYFRDVSDKIVKFRNNFTTKSGFKSLQIKNLIVPEYNNVGFIIENTIDNISFAEILKVNEYVKLRNNGSIIERDGSKVVMGTFSQVGSLTLVPLEFEPDLVIVYHEHNNKASVAGQENQDTWDIKVPRILTRAYSGNYGYITTNGFMFYGYASANSEGTTQYIAIKF